MEQFFYLGSTQIVFHLDEPLTLQQWDRKFTRKILDIQRRIDVFLKIVTELPIPEGDSVLIRGYRLWYTKKGIFRMHKGRKDSPAHILSHLRDSGTVDLYVKDSEWDRQKLSFRPWFHIHLEDLLLECHAVVLHSASIVYRDKAIVFTAPSGTGKTTQTDLWHKYRLGVADINGDRTLLQKTDDGWMACGFPVFGSTVRCEQVAAPIGAIVIVRQARDNLVRELSLIEKIGWLYTETTVLSENPGSVNRAMDLIEELAHQVKILILDCNMEESAVDVLEQAIIGD